jgi:hypothetical protein
LKFRPFLTEHHYLLLLLLLLLVLLRAVHCFPHLLLLLLQL